LSFVTVCLNEEKIIRTSYLFWSFY